MHDFLLHGALRPGGRAYDTLLKDRTVYEQQMTLLDYQLFADKAHPYLLTGPGEVQVTLVRVKSEVYSTVLKRLDQLEGYISYRGDGNQNERILLQFDYQPDDEVPEGGEGRAWLYVTPAQRRTKVEQLPRVLSGDWLTWERSHPTRIGG